MSVKPMKTIKHKDVDAMKALARTNMMTPEQLKSLGLTNNRIMQMAKAKYLKRLCYTDKAGKSFNVYCLGNKGEQYCSKVLGVTSFYGSVGQHHDIALANEYLKLSPTERETVRTEVDMRREMTMQIRNYQEISQNKTTGRSHRDRAKEEYDRLYDMLRNNELSAVDMTYTSDEGVEIAIEIITDNYSNQEIQAKENFAHEMKLKLHKIKC